MARKKRAPEFGEWLKITRKARGMTQQQLADAMDVSKGIVSNWENAQYAISDESIAGIATALRLDYHFVKRVYLREANPGALADQARKGQMGPDSLTALERILDDFDSLPDDGARIAMANKFHDMVQRALKKIGR